jgi:sulfane dehydrogenase subunit SoxC
MKDKRTTSPRRRRVLGGLGAASLATVLLPRARAAVAPLPVEPWSQQPGEPGLWHPYGLPSDFEKDVVRRISRPPAMPGATSTLTPLGNLFGAITPNGLVFERHHSGVPLIDPAQHRFVIHGLVKQAREFTLDDLMRFPSVSRVHFLECSGNTASEWKGPSGLPVQMTHGLLSCCEWTGVPLSTVLDEVGVAPEAKWFLAEGSDAAAMTRSIPLAKGLDDALLVYAQNGEHLRPENGYPLRLLLPGFEGNTNIKWLRRIKLAAEPFMTREETSKYTDLQADGLARQFVFEMDAKSVITRPSAGQHLGGPGFYPVSGLAWSGRGRITRVEVSMDGGRTWRDATLQGPVQSKAATRFEAGWHWDGAPADLQSRATDETGYVQPTRDALVAARGLNSYYHYNGIQNWQVAANGEIRNA